MPDDPFKPIAGSGGGAAKPKREAEWASITPVPPDAPAAPREHPSLGLPTQIWDYRSADGLLGHVMRFDEAGGGKSFRPCCLFRHKLGRLEWRWESWAEPRPLYGLDQLAENGSRSEPIIVCEGEKAADAVAELAGLVAVTSPAGSKSAGKANWQPLSGRDVVIWPDADEAGAKYAETVASLLTLARAKSVKVIAPPGGVVGGWDAADALDEGWTADQVRELIAAAAPAASGQGKGGKKKPSDGEEGEGKRPRQRDSLIAAADAAILWHSPQRVPYATVPVNGHHEHLALGSGRFEEWLAGRYYEATGNAPSGQMLADAKRVLTVRAIETGPTHLPETRIAWHDGASWLDLGDEQWRAIRIGPTGWEVVAAPPVKFIRSQPMKALPEPEPGYLLEAELRRFINADDDDYILVVSWLVATLWGKSDPGRPKVYPLLALGGEQGSGKTTVALMLRSISDPSAVPAVSIPREERDLIALASSAHVLSFDNVSKIESWFSDALCRIATGAGFFARKLHSDSDAFYFQGSRPCILNGIPALTDRADLAERSIAVHLKAIPDDERQSEDDLWREWDAALPRILGSLLDAVSAAVRNYDQVRLKRMPRLASFAKLMAATEGALGWEQGTFERAYSERQRQSADEAFEADPVSMAILRLMKMRGQDPVWEGTATMLLQALNDLVPEDMRRSRWWPAKVNGLGAAVARAEPGLRNKGIQVTHRRAGSQRTITLTTTSSWQGG